MSVLQISRVDCAIDSAHYTLKCLSIGTPKTINFPFVSNEKLMIFRCSNIQAHYLKMVNFPFGTNGKFIILDVPILKHIRVLSCAQSTAESCFFTKISLVLMILINCLYSRLVR